MKLLLLWAVCLSLLGYTVKDFLHVLAGGL